MMNNWSMFEGGEVRSLKTRLVSLLSMMTIEPMMLVQGVAGGISEIATSQMLVYKTCRGLRV